MYCALSLDRSQSRFRIGNFGEPCDCSANLDFTLLTGNRHIGDRWYLDDTLNPSEGTVVFLSLGS